MAKLCKPDRVYWCNGSKAERKALTAEAVKMGILIKLNQKKLPGRYYHRSNPNDVALTPNQGVRWVRKDGPKPKELIIQCELLLAGL